MKLLKATALCLMIATPTFAGGLAEPYMEPDIIVEDTTSSSRAGILIPILAILLIALTAGNDGGGQEFRPE